jgi:adenosylcobinamide-GDP ribazoletransferase
LTFLAALRFLTNIPLPGRRRIKPEDIGRSIIFFPVIGLIIGLILVGLNWLMLIFLPSSLVDVLLLAALVAIGGALHLRGFINTGNSIAGGFGIIGVFFLLLAKYFALSNIPWNWMAETLVLMPVISRWTMSYVIAVSPSAPSSALSRAYKREASWWRLLIATVITLVVVVLLLQLTGLMIMFIVWMAVLAMVAYLKGKFGGLTADAYGAINEAAEVYFIILICLLAHIRWLD